MAEAATKEDVNEVKIAVNRVLLVLEGNGNPEKGLVGQMLLMNQWRVNHEKAHDQVSKDWRSIVFPLIDKGLTALIGAGIAYIAVKGGP
jgi:kynureninase